MHPQYSWNPQVDPVTGQPKGVLGGPPATPAVPAPRVDVPEPAGFEVTDPTFDAAVVQRSKTIPVILDVWAP